ncbi:PilZ domain-containing protein [Motiliproteus sp. SC1-56]|uniref:PilZ domain-containing protein n=1 Tax=Motiliproteus sp. SC1-56 TaxID=2799565 RepID=UPI001A8CD9E5|nr:PilZ domain-containing protein [Motiliproteus sp. SC1-56]
MTDFRRHPRINTDITVELRSEAGETCRSVIRNLSPGGLMVNGDPSLKETVCGPQERDPLVHPVEVNVRFQLPNETVPFRARCRLVFVRRLSQFEFNLGLRFIDVTAQQSEQIRRYIYQDMQQFNPAPQLAAER